jgi:hypothetical protein
VIGIFARIRSIPAIFPPLSPIVLTRFSALLTKICQPLLEVNHFMSQLPVIVEIGQSGTARRSLSRSNPPMLGKKDQDPCMDYWEPAEVRPVGSRGLHHPIQRRAGRSRSNWSESKETSIVASPISRRTAKCAAPSMVVIPDLAARPRKHSNAVRRVTRLDFAGTCQATAADSGASATVRRMRLSSLRRVKSVSNENRPGPKISTSREANKNV